MRLLLAALLMVLVDVSHTAQNPPAQIPLPPASEWVHIDGAKNPELIPEWSVWKSAFAMFQLVGELPTPVMNHLSKDEAKTVLAGSAEHQKNVAACEQRVLRLRPLVGKEAADAINRHTQEINLDCRWQTLRLRDRVLEALGPDGQVALRQWVEGTKAGIQVSVPKAELDFYLKPK